MTKIKGLFAKDITRKIEEVIKVEQADQETVRSEIGEYVVTEAIRDHYASLLKAIAEAPSQPHEGIGVWVSGFFGSGKSSFAKILGYIVANKKLGDVTAPELFKERVRDDKVGALLDSIVKRIPIHPVIFDVSMERGVRVGNERITEIMYKALLRELGYAEDFDLAQLEIDLEADGKLDHFKNSFEKVHKKRWDERKKLGLAVMEASRVLHEIEKDNFPKPDSWATAIGKGRADITPNLLAERTYELATRRKAGSAIIFVIDEVGQYVARSVDKMTDLMGVIHAFGVEGKNRVKGRKATAPCWIIVTSQEKLSEVVESLEFNKIELARLQDRFSIQIDLKQSDIAEVAGKRVLEKNKDGAQALTKLFKENEGRIKACCALEGAGRQERFDLQEHVHLYPYLPYQIDLCIDIVSGFRLRRGAHRHVGGSNRTIIKQAQEMMLNRRTNLAEAEIGTLVTFDKVYELLSLGSLVPNEIVRDLDAIPKNFSGNAMVEKVAKAIALLEVVPSVPRSPHNIAVVLHPSIESDSVLKEVTEALDMLEKAQVIKRTGEGYKLLSVQEKSWDTERNEVQPKRADRNRILREAVGEIISEAKKIPYQGFRSFTMALSVDGETVDADGDMTLNLQTVDDPDARKDRLDEVRRESAEKANELFWVLTKTGEIDQLITELYRSKEMVVAYEQRQSQQRLTAEQVGCLADEKMRKDRTERELSATLTKAFIAGAGFFEGVQKDGSGLGKTMEEVLHRFVGDTIPKLYPKLDVGALPVEKDTALDFLKAANLSGLPQFFYEDSKGQPLVKKESGRFIPNPFAPLCQEVVTYLKAEHNYGNRVTGKMLEGRFEGIGYGWRSEVIRLALAILLRSGSIEVVHQGRRHRDHSDPGCRTPFTTAPAFRAASFAPREAIDLKTLTGAVRQIEQMTGKEVAVEEAAVAQSFKDIAAKDREALLPQLASMRAFSIPGVEDAQEFLERVEGVLQMPTDDCVKTLAGEGKSYREARERLMRLGEALSDDHLTLLRSARVIVSDIWPVLKERNPDADTVQKATELIELLGSDDFFMRFDAINSLAQHLRDLFIEQYCLAHKARSEAAASAVAEIKGMAEWAEVTANPAIAEGTRVSILAPLVRQSGHDPELAGDELICGECRASLAQLEAERMAVGALAAEAVARMRELLSPREKIERVRVARFIPTSLDSPEEIEEAIAKLKEHLLKIVATGAKVVLE